MCWNVVFDKLVLLLPSYLFDIPPLKNIRWVCHLPQSSQVVFSLGVANLLSFCGMFSVVVSSKLHGTTPSLHGCIVLSVDPSSNKTGTEEKFVTGIDWMLSKSIACPTDSVFVVNNFFTGDEQGHGSWFSTKRRRNWNHCQSWNHAYGNNYNLMIF